MNHHSFNRVALIAALLFAFAIGQSRAELPPEAQEAMNKGLQAAKQQEWIIAIQSFQEALKSAKDAEDVPGSFYNQLFYNLGLAESKIPGRELRAIAWFGAYLAANPSAPNAAAVNDFITGLKIKNQGSLFRLIKTYNDAAKHNSRDDHIPFDFESIAGLWAKAGDMPAAMKIADSFEDSWHKIEARINIAEAQAKTGDDAGARETLASATRTADLIQSALTKGHLLRDIAEAQAKIGDSTGAKETLASAARTVDLIQSASDKSASDKIYQLKDIAEAQAKAGDDTAATQTFGSALKTAGAIHDADKKQNALYWIAYNEVEVHDFTNAQKIVDLLRGDSRAKMQNRIRLTQEAIKVGVGGYRWWAEYALASTRATWPITASDWLNKLGELDDEFFLDLAGYLKTLPSDNPDSLLAALRDTVDKIATSQIIIGDMLKQQAEQQAKK